MASEDRGHAHSHAFSTIHRFDPDGLTLGTRRNFLRSSMAGMAGLSLPGLLQARAQASATGRPIGGRKSVILLWMAGGPSHIDTWDPKPDRPYENRGPFGTIATAMPGVRICEHLPKQAAMLDKFTLIRSVDATFSNHEPNTVFQTGHLEAEPRLNPRAGDFPAIGSVVAKHYGANDPGMPPYVVFQLSRSHLAYAGDLGAKYDPFPGHRASKLPIYTDVGVDTGRMSTGELFTLPKGLDEPRIRRRMGLLGQFDQLRATLDQAPTMSDMDTYGQQAVELLVGPRAREAFDLEREPASTRERYGKHPWCQQALLARRLVEAGSAFVTLDLSYHPASGTWDTHGDNIPPYGGIARGLGPLLPLFDHLITTLVTDLEQRGLIDDVLVIAMGEFGRTPKIGTQGSTDGRNHWPNVASMCLAGGGLRHGQVIGATEADGGYIKERPVTPGDFAATIYQYFGVPLNTEYHEPDGRPRPVVEKGSPVEELFG